MTSKRYEQKALGQDPGVFEKILKKVIWELDGTVPSSQLMFRRLSVLVATRPKLGTHMSGNRAQISDIMLSGGFVAYPFEFWHYSQGDLFQAVLDTGNASARYGAINFHPKSGSVVPVDDPFASLHTLSEIEETIQDTLKNLKTE